jgi:hypothetical protein
MRKITAAQETMFVGVAVNGTGGLKYLGKASFGPAADAVFYDDRDQAETIGRSCALPPGWKFQGVAPAGELVESLTRCGCTDFGRA